MSVTPRYPGVYIEEIPSGARTITGVATSIAAFVDNFRRGPLNEAVRILSYADFEREFGGLEACSEASYAIRQFFLNGGSEAYVVRVGTTPLAAAAAVINAGSSPALRATAARRIRGAAVDDPGMWGNFLRLEVNYDTARLPNATLDPDGLLTQNELFNLVVREVELRDGRTWVRQAETFANLTLRAGVPTNALEMVNDSSKLVQLSRTGLTALPAAPAPPFRPDPTGTLSAVLAFPPVVPPNGAQLDVTVYPDGPAGPAAAITRILTLNYGGPAPAGADYSFVRSFLEAALRAAEPQDPLFSGAIVSLAGGRYHVLLGRNGVGFNPAATVSFANAAVGEVADDLQLSARAGALVGPQQVALANGADSGVLTKAALRGVRARKTGLFALENADLFNILCVPAAAALPTANAMRNFYVTAERYCEERRAFLIIDIPEATDDLDGMRTWLARHAALRHRNAAVYFPRTQVADPLNGGRLRSVAPSGTIAGLYSRTDSKRGVWKAPAGTEATLVGVQAATRVLTDMENGTLNPLGVNCIRLFPALGPVAWGARTLQGDDQMASEWKYIPVRRLALFIEESVYRGTKWAVFEPNDEPLWAQLRLNVGVFMHNLFRQGAFQGLTPRDAYFVKCDKETTSQNDIALGIVNIIVGFAALRPAEFVIIKVQQIAGQIQT